MGNLGGFAAPYITGVVSGWTGGYQVPMFIVGFFMVLSSVLMFVLGRNTKQNERRDADAAAQATPTATTAQAETTAQATPTATTAQAETTAQATTTTTQERHA
ncbi:hypothetical protein [Curtobacterium sp. 24E2]